MTFCDERPRKELLIKFKSKLIVMARKAPRVLMMMMMIKTKSPNLESGSLSRQRRSTKNFFPPTLKQSSSSPSPSSLVW